MTEDRRPEGEASGGLFEALLALRDRQRAERQACLVRFEERPWEESALGSLKWYMHPELRSVVAPSLLFFIQRLPAGGRSGRLKHPGGQVIYVWHGNGATVVDGVRHAWRQGDVIQLPLRPGGVIVQHFADPDAEADLVCVEPNWVDAAGVDRGSGFEVLEACPGGGVDPRGSTPRQRGAGEGDAP